MISHDLKLSARTETIKQIAKEQGFMDCKIAKADVLNQEAKQLESWLNLNYQGEMSYMANHFDLRIDPRKLVPGAKSVIVLSQNYYPESKQNAEAPKLAKYAYGRDYHKVIKKKLKSFLNELEMHFGEVEGRGFVDSAPVLEKAWAKRSGLGWMGKHTNILTKQKGSFFFLAVLIVDLELVADEAVPDYCGNCTACIDACPTDAIVSPYLLNASKCISYATIELKANELPYTFSDKMNNWMFGCDICQDVCPWNRFSKPHAEPDFNPKNELMEMTTADWVNFKEEKFKDLFAGSAVNRTKYSGLMRNIKFLPISPFDETSY